MQPQTNYQCSRILAPNQLYPASHCLYLGNKSALKSQNIQMFQISSIVSIMDKYMYEKMEINKKVQETGIPKERYLWVNLEDDTEADIMKHFEQVHGFIDEMIKSTNVLVHCMAGISRSATFVISYIMKQKNMNLEKANKYVVQRRYQVAPNLGFLQALKAYENKINLLDPPTQYTSKKYQTIFCHHIISLKNPSCLETHNLFLGQATAIKTQYLTNLNIKGVLTLLSQSESKQLKIKELCEHLGITHKLIEIDDRPEEDMMQYLNEGIQFIRQNLGKGNVIVHCRQGKSRSATVVIGFLMVELKMKYEYALNFTKGKRDKVCPNHGFIQQLKKLDLK